LKDRGQGQAVHEIGLFERDCLNLEIKPQKSLEVSVAIYLSTQPNFSQDFKQTLLLFETFFAMGIMKGFSTYDTAKMLA
jgi:hypothetical protein